MISDSRDLTFPDLCDPGTRDSRAGSGCDEIVCSGEHDPCTTPGELCIVDDQRDGLDPSLVVQVSCCRATPTGDAETRFVELVGTLDVHAVAQIHHVLERFVWWGGDVVFDLAGVISIDGAGPGMFAALQNVATACDGRLWLHDPSPVVRRLIAATSPDGFDTTSADRFDVCVPRSSRHRSVWCERSTEFEGLVWSWDGSDQMCW